MGKPIFKITVKTDTESLKAMGVTEEYDEKSQYSGDGYFLVVCKSGKDKDNITVAVHGKVNPEAVVHGLMAFQEPERLMAAITRQITKNNLANIAINFSET